jgi:hypothetical protein
MTRTMLGLATVSMLVLGMFSIAASQTASGAGHFTAGGAKRNFSFSALTLEDGTVTGDAQLLSRAANVKIHLAVNCLVIVDNIAFISGVVTRENAPDVAVGDIGVFAVQDNGEGGSNTTDQITQVAFNPPSSGIDCNDGTTLPFIPIQQGNVQVEP